MKLSVATFFGDRLNLDGDQANLQVLTRRAEEYGHQLEVTSVSSSAQVESADLIFIGHGSIAAWRSIQADTQRFITGLGDKLVLAIGSGAVHLAAVSGVRVSEGAHESKFVQQHFTFVGQEFDVIGYLNSSVEGIETRAEGSRILSMLHGPLLAKNPKLADAILQHMLRNRGEELGERPASLRLLDELSARAAKDSLR